MDSAGLDRIDKQIARIEDADPSEAGPLWGEVHQFLLKAHADAKEVARIIMSRDLGALRELAGRLRDGPDAAPVPSPTESEATEPVDHGIPPETLKKAMRAYRKRLKLTRLDHESRLGVGPLSGGKKADIDGILPPREFPKEVWDALVIEGRLKNMGQGFYELVEE